MLPVRRRRPPRAAVHAPAQGEAVPPLRILRAPVARLPEQPLLQLLQDRTQERELPGGEGRGAGRAGAVLPAVRPRGSRAEKLPRRVRPRRPRVNALLRVRTTRSPVLRQTGRGGGGDGVRRRGTGENGRNRKTCAKCGGRGHVDRECARGAGATRAPEFACYRCGEAGHLARECPNDGRGGNGGDGRPGSAGGGGGGGRGRAGCGNMSFGGGGGWARGTPPGGDLRRSLGGGGGGGGGGARGGYGAGGRGGGGGGGDGVGRHNVQVRVGVGGGHRDGRRHVRYSQDDVDFHEGRRERWGSDRQNAGRETNAPWSTGKRRYDDRNYRR